VAALPRLYGEPGAVLREARGLCKGTLGAALGELEEALAELAALGPHARVTLDLGEVRGFDYYTGVRFAGFASGHGNALVAGGRYDDLCARYGRAARATGFAIDVEAVAGALEVRGAAAGRPRRAGRGVLVAGPRPLAPRVAAKLRNRGERAACQPGGVPSEPALLAYAAHWEFAGVMLVSPGGATVVDRDGRRRKLSAQEWRELTIHG
jgi:ATP phosphoribosyltransferase regulatory subunit